MGRSRRWIELAIPAMLLGLTSCEPETVSNIQGLISSVQVSLERTTLNVGQSLQADGLARNYTGTVLQGVSISWSSSNPGVAAVSSSGLITAVAVGSARIVGTAGTQSGSVDLTIVPVAAAVASVTVSLSPATVLA